jgi:hypothetical protein
MYYNTTDNTLYFWNGTAWVAASAASAPDILRYGGAYTSGTYNDGDIRIGADGVTYMCVTNGTTTAPVPWTSTGPTGPAGPQGPQGPTGLTGPAGAGVPTPVVNGQWVKGQSGAAAWSAMAQTDLPLTPYATTLPASPFHGQEAILVDSVTAPTYQWLFRYNANNTTAYKWEFIGGSPMFAGPMGSVTLATSQTTGIDITGGPVLTVLRAGIYRYTFGALVYNAGTFTGAYLTYCQVFVGAAGIGAYLSKQYHGVVYDGANISNASEVTLNANSVLNMKSWMDRTGNATGVSGGWIHLMPVRVS